MTLRRRLRARTARGRAVLHLAGDAGALGRRGHRRRAPSCPARGRPVRRGWTRSTRPSSPDREGGARPGAARMPADVEASTLVHHARSTPAGLLEVAEAARRGDDRAGSSRRARTGHVSLGRSATGSLHSSHIPVALAPRGYRAAAHARSAGDRRVRRLPRRTTSSRPPPASPNGWARDAPRLVRGPLARPGRGRRRRKRGARDADCHDSGARARRSSARRPGPPRSSRGRRPRRDLGRGARGRRVARRRGPRRRLHLDRARSPGSSSAPAPRRSSATPPCPVVVVPRGGRRGLAEEAIRAEPPSGERLSGNSPVMPLSR